jgi:N-acetylglucosamine kinase-like BadF-type ATPase
VGDATTLLATATTGPSNIVRVGEAQTRDSLLAAVRQACAAAGIAPQQIERTCVGGSGAARPELAQVVREILGEVLHTPIIVVGDMETALESAFESGPGVIVIAGTGSIAFGRDRSGRTLRAGGWGFAIGDEGSAHWIGRAAVNALLRDSDRDQNAAHSSLADGLFKAWKVNSLSDLARAANSIPPPDFARLFPAVVGSQDALAKAVLEHAGRELAAIAGVVIGCLFAKEQTESVRVAMTGGVFRHAALVREVFYNEVRTLDPRAEVNPRVVDPVEGALRMARRN